MPPNELSPDEFESGGEPTGNETLPISSFESGGEPTDQGAASAPQAEQEAAALTIRDYLASNGINQQFPDDFAAVNYLIRERQEAERLRSQQAQLDAYAQVGRQVAPHATQLQQFFQQQQAPAGPKPWQPPPFDERWASLVTQDPASGVYLGKPGTPTEVVDAANKYANWMRDFQRNPGAVMEAMATEREAALTKRIEQQFEQRFEQRQTEQRTQAIVQQNASWFYQRDQQGNVMRDPIMGGPLPSPVGRQYLQAVQMVASMGVTNPEYRDQLAKALLKEQLAQVSAPSTQGNPPTQAQRRAAPVGRPNRNPLQALSAQERRENPVATDPDGQGSLRDRMKKLFEQEGITDRDIAWGEVG